MYNWFKLFKLNNECTIIENFEKEKLIIIKYYIFNPETSKFQIEWFLFKIRIILIISKFIIIFM